MTPGPHPVAILVPYLSLSEPASFAGWWLGPLDSFDGPWLSDEFAEAVRVVAHSFADVAGHRLERPSLLVRCGPGANGDPPGAHELDCLQLAISFAAIHQNPYWSPENRHDSWRVATADNASIWVQPIDLSDRRITLGHGSRVDITKGGYRYSDDGFTIPAPLELHLPFGVRLDAVVLTAAYTVLRDRPVGFEHLADSLRVAMRWLAKSWMNTPSITWEDRLVFVKVATEALTGKDRNHESARELVRLYELATKHEGEGIGLDDLIWSPGEALVTRRWTDRHTGKAREAEVTLLEDWALALGDARNAIVHGEAVADLQYTRDDSPYCGPFVEIGDRVVRELIAVLLGECGYPDAWRTGMSRASLAMWRALRDGGLDEAE